MKYLFFWGVIISSFCFYIYNENQNWREEMVSKYGYVFVTEHGDKYHASYHYHNKNYRITMLEAYERGKNHCSVCNSPTMANFSMEKDKLPWYQIHWFFSIVLVNIGFFILILDLMKDSSFFLQFIFCAKNTNFSKPRILKG